MPSLPPVANRPVGRGERKPFGSLEYFLFAFLGVIVVAVLFAFYIIIRLEFRHDEAFARRQLAAMGYEEIEIEKRSVSGVGHNPPSQTNFQFSARKGGRVEERYLVCCISFQDIGDQRCGVYGEWWEATCSRSEPSAPRDA